MDIRHATHPADARALTGEQLRQRFLHEDLFVEGEVRFALTHEDRIVIGGAVPGEGSLQIDAPDELRSEYFCQRREVAIVAIAGSGVASVDGTDYPLELHDVLYVGLGARSIELSGSGARFYLASSLASAQFPTAIARRADAETLHLGQPEAANVRELRRYLHDGGVLTDRLVLGVTTLQPGSVWNTMPPHTHDRRTEVYLYTGLGAEGRVMHLCGEPNDLRTIVVANDQAVVSPSWSVHAGAGTQAYSFVWAMAGENRAFDDMDAVPVAELR